MVAMDRFAGSIRVVTLRRLVIGLLLIAFVPWFSLIVPRLLHMM